MNSPCISTLTLGGQNIGQAFILTDAVNQAHIIAVPNGNNFDFSYNFASTAPHCSGDSGTGTIVIQTSPWDYIQPHH